MFIRLSARTFVGPLEQRVFIIGRDLKFAEYFPHYKILTGPLEQRVFIIGREMTGNIFGLILKNKMAATGVFVSHEKCLYLPYYWS